MRKIAMITQDNLERKHNQLHNATHDGYIVDLRSHVVEIFARIVPMGRE
ncbi:MAG: hypothetical protein SNI45_06780 [Rikenellaceae bacterium]